MAVIAVANPKGGAGKSTTCLILATTFARQKASVKLLDTDPQRTVGKWGDAGISRYAGIIETVTDERLIVGSIDRHAAENQFVIVDVQGRATLTMARVMSRADLVIIPMQAKTADAEEAARAIQAVRDEEEALRRQIDHRILYTRTVNNIVTREERDILKAMQEKDIPQLQTALNERTAYSRLHSYKLALEELDPVLVNGIEGAIENAARLAKEVLTIILNQKQ